MVKQYPYTLIIQAAAGNSTQNSDGDWVQPEGEAPDPVQVPCRPEPRSSVGYVQSGAGKMIEFSSIVYTPLTVPDIAVDTVITITGVSPEITGTVKQFRRGQYNARIWI